MVIGKLSGFLQMKLPVTLTNQSSVYLVVTQLYDKNMQILNALEKQIYNCNFQTWKILTRKTTGSYLLGEIWEIINW